MDELSTPPGATVDCRSTDKFLDTIERSSSVALPSAVRDHIDSCDACWSKWVNIRWELAADTVDLKELKTFLGNDFQHGVDSSWNLASEWNALNPSNRHEVEQFYRDTGWYIYNLVLWHSSGQRPVYSDIALRPFELHGVRTLLDFGAGVGNDCLRFAELGFQVSALELNTLCREFLKWRAKQRRLDIHILPSTGAPSIDFDVVWAMDVIEHLPLPISTLQPFLERAEWLVFDCEHDGNSNGRHPFHFQHDPSQLELELTEIGYTRVAWDTGDIAVFQNRGR